MKLLSILLNFALLMMVAFMLLEHGMPAPNDSDFFFALLAIAAPAITLYYLLFCVNSESWLQLYFRRKAAEEKQRLYELESKNKSQQ
ncbi:hypothetical protein [Ectopseudomonas khazarica]|uniref:hypothetical protein n=1 Tax=Ectopseudomonas khazarica TaxID=2502979 RepID=UPI0037C6E0E7